MAEKNKKLTASPYLVPALERGLKILEMLSDYPGGLLMNEMKELDLPNASLYRMLVTLTELGYVVKDSSDRYRLGRKLLSVGYKALDNSNLAETSAAFQRELRNMVNETVALGVICDKEGVVVDTVRSEQAVCVYVQIGHHFPLHTAAPAKAILAFLPAAERSQLIDSIVFTKFNKNTITSKEAYLAELEKVRNSGTAFDLGEEISDLRCVAAPIFDSRSYPVAAIWVTGPESRLNSKKLKSIGSQVKETAEKISKYII
jgi:DNA-binding IclR family transcriptional regulator